MDFTGFWNFLDQVFGDKTKLIVTVLGIVGGLITIVGGLIWLRVEILRYRRNREKNERADDIAARQLTLDEAERRLRTRQDNIEGREQKITQLRQAVLGSEEALWRLHDPRPPARYRDSIIEKKPPVIFISNEKGGVGKSTTTVLLASHFAVKQFKVLVIDLDYHASSTKMLLGGSDIIPSTLQNLLTSGSSTSTFEHAVSEALPNLSVVTAGEALSPHETKVQVDYLLQESDEDVRYMLARLLVSDRLRERFDVILLDSPPRLTTAAVNGLCASTHILVPTKLERVSAEAVGPFLVSTKRLMAHLNPSLNLLGIIANDTSKITGLSDREKTERNVVLEQVAQAWGAEAFLFERHIPHRAAIQHAAAARKNAYSANREIQSVVGTLGDEILRQLGAAAPTSRTEISHESQPVA